MSIHTYKVFCVQHTFYLLTRRTRKTIRACCVLMAVQLTCTTVTPIIHHKHTYVHTVRCTYIHTFPVEGFHNHLYLPEQPERRCILITSWWLSWSLARQVLQELHICIYTYNLTDDPQLSQLMAVQLTNTLVTTWYQGLFTSPSNGGSCPIYPVYSPLSYTLGGTQVKSP